MDAPPRQLAPLFQRPTLFLAVYTMLYTPVIETSTSLLQPSAAVHAALSEEQCVVTAPSMTSLHDAPASVYGNEASCSTSAWPCTVHFGRGGVVGRILAVVGDGVCADLGEVDDVTRHLNVLRDHAIDLVGARGTIVDVVALVGGLERHDVRAEDLDDRVGVVHVLDLAAAGDGVARVGRRVLDGVGAGLVLREDLGASLLGAAVVRALDAAPRVLGEEITGDIAATGRATALGHALDGGAGAAAGVDGHGGRDAADAVVAVVEEISDAVLVEEASRGVVSVGVATGVDVSAGAVLKRAVAMDVELRLCRVSHRDRAGHRESVVAGLVLVVVRDRVRSVELVGGLVDVVRDVAGAAKGGLLTVRRALEGRSGGSAGVAVGVVVDVETGLDVTIDVGTSGILTALERHGLGRLNGAVRARCDRGVLGGGARALVVLERLDARLGVVRDLHLHAVHLRVAVRLVAEVLREVIDVPVHDKLRLVEHAELVRASDLPGLRVDLHVHGHLVRVTVVVRGGGGAIEDPLRRVAGAAARMRGRFTERMVAQARLEVGAGLHHRGGLRDRPEVARGFDNALRGIGVARAGVPHGTAHGGRSHRSLRGERVAPRVLGVGDVKASLLVHTHGAARLEAVRPALVGGSVARAGLSGGEANRGGERVKEEERENDLVGLVQRRIK